MKKIIYFCLIFLTLKAQADSYLSKERLSVDLSGGYFSMQVKKKATETAAASNTSFSQLELRPTLSYFLTPKLSVGLYYFQTTLIEDFNSNGFGIHGKWYFSKRGSVRDVMVENKKITLTPTWAPYVQASLKRQTLEGETVTVKFSGFEVGCGVDRHLKDGYFFNLQLQVSSMTSGSTRTATTQSLMGGIGKTF